MSHIVLVKDISAKLVDVNETMTKFEERNGVTPYNQTVCSLAENMEQTLSDVQSALTAAHDDLSHAM